MDENCNIVGYGAKIIHNKTKQEYYLNRYPCSSDIILTDDAHTKTFFPKYDDAINELVNYMSKHYPEDVRGEYLLSVYPVYKIVKYVVVIEDYTDTKFCIKHYISLDKETYILTPSKLYAEISNTPYDANLLIANYFKYRRFNANNRKTSLKIYIDEIEINE